MIEKYRDALPEEIRRDYLRRVDEKCAFLTPLPRRYWQPTREVEKVGLEKQLEDWKETWKKGLIKAVDERKERNEAARALWG